MGECIFLGILLVVSIGAFFLTGTFTPSPFDSSSGPAVFPRIASLGLAVCCVILLVEKIKKKEYKAPFQFAKLFYGPAGAMIYSSLIFMVLMNYLGFMLSCALYLLFIVNYFKYQADGTLGSPAAVAVRSAGLAASAFLIAKFINMANIMLPIGKLFT